MASSEKSFGLHDLEEALFKDGYDLAKEYAHRDDVDASLSAAINVFYSQLDALTGLFLDNAAKQGSPAHCKKGCSYCCHQAVFAQDYEIRYLKQCMFKNLSHGQLGEIQARAKRKNDETSVLEKKDQLHFRRPCPLLSEGKCMAYETRPVACRIYLSKSVESCIMDHEKPGDPDHFPRLFDVILRLGRKMNQGFAARLAELEVEITEHALEAGLLKS